MACRKFLHLPYIFAQRPYTTLNWNAYSFGMNCAFPKPTRDRADARHVEYSV